MSLYPSRDFVESYSTRNPVFATVGAVCIIVFTSLAFFLYDALVRHEFHNKQVILEAKRKFMRFVSHEVRTPLNTVVMGLKLMQEEVESMTPESQSSPDKREIIPYVIKLSQQILDSAESAVTVLSDLLNYDKIEMGQLSLEPTIIGIWDLIQSCTEEFRLPFQAKNIKFALDFDSIASRPDVECASPRITNAAELPYVVKERRFVGDSIRITQVLRNLVSNAMKFTPEGGKFIVLAEYVASLLNFMAFSPSARRPVLHSLGKVTVRLSWLHENKENTGKNLDDFKLSNHSDPVAYERSGVLKVDVTDTGAGMSPDQVAKLFQSGVQFNVNQLQSGKGSGLGLYIAKGIVEQHGGTLSASSKGIGNGTTFTMTLPLHYIPDALLPDGMDRLILGKPDNEDCDQSTANDATITSREESARDPLRVLVVDDAAMNRKLLTRLLEKRGYTCDQAENGQEAVDKVVAALKADCPYDTILMDFEMPVMNGPEAARQIRELGCDPFIAGITGNVLPEDVAFFKENGANWVFPKPVRIPDLEALWHEYGILG